MAVAREHIDPRELTDWYPEWIYETMEIDEVRNQAYRNTIDKAVWAIYCARAGAGDVVEMVFQSDVSGNPRYFLKLARMMSGAGKEIGQYSWIGD